MKKTLIALAVLGVASTAMAADVTLYGRIDTGLAYKSVKVDGKDRVNTTEMTSGWSTGSRWGIKGAEDLGNGLKVGFVLESGFTSDDGALNNDGRLFGRESVVYLSGDLGTLYAGRLGSIASDAGSIGLLGNTSVFGNCYGLATAKGSTGSAWARHDNTLAYVTPSYSGLQASFMYSMKSNSVAKDADTGELKDKGTENKGNTNRYAAFGLKYAGGPLTLVLAADYTLKANVAGGADPDDAFTVTAGGNYKFDAATVYAKANYFKDTTDALDTFGLIKDAGLKALKGYGLELGVKVPAAGGNVMAAVGYRDAEEEATNIDCKRYNLGLGYTYAFSKRTNVYGAVGYAQEEVGAKDGDGYQVGIGLVHKF